MCDAICLEYVYQMNLSDFAPFEERKLLAPKASVRQWDQFEKAATDLSKMALATVGDIEKFIHGVNEWLAASFDDGDKAYVRMTCHTENKAYAEEYEFFLKEIEPKIKVWGDCFDRMYLASPARQDFLKKHPDYAIADRRTETSAKLFREENIALSTEVELLGKRYQSLMGALSVKFQGKDIPIVQMQKFLLEPDRKLREDAYRAMGEAYLSVGDQADDIFDEMITLRNQMAKNAGFKNARDYFYEAKCRFDYGPSEVAGFRKTIRESIVPIAAEMLKSNAKLMGIDKIRPWDTQCDPTGRAPLKPCENSEVMLQKCQSVFEKLDSGLSKEFRMMREVGLFDLDSRKGKAPGGYQTVFSESRYPFIFMNCVGSMQDIWTMFHEAGHAFHTWAMRDNPFFMQLNPPMEFAEVASMAMELLATKHLEEILPNKEDAARAMKDHLEKAVVIFPHIARVDGFQDWVYTTEKPDRKSRRAYWSKLMTEFNTGIDWTGLEDIRDSLWHRQLHIFLHPFYYVEYGIAQLGALQVWMNSLKDFSQSLNKYKTALAKGYGESLPKLFESAGARFDFSSATVKPLMEQVQGMIK